MSKLDRVIYVIENGQIIETTARQMSGYIEQTTTPHGVAPKYHLRGNQLWTWGHAGNFPKMVRGYETEQEATEGLEETFWHDFSNHPDMPSWYFTRGEAELKLASTVVNPHGKSIDFDSAHNLMDGEICNAISADMAPCSTQAFFDEYCKRHQIQFGEAFEPSKASPVW